jgi:hypothetical protein
MIQEVGQLSFVESSCMLMDARVFQANAAQWIQPNDRYSSPAAQGQYYSGYHGGYYDYQQQA